MTTGNKFETRVVSEKIEIRAAADGKGRILSGYAARFDIKSGVIAGSFREIIRAGAFRDTLGGGVDAILSVNHDPSRLLARTKSGTLRLREDATGLAFEADLPETTLGNDVAIMVERGDYGGMSFQFSKKRDSWSEDTDGLPLRELLAVDLRDVTVATFPAYPDGTSVSLRSDDQALAELRAWKDARPAKISNALASRRLRLAAAIMRG